MNAKPDVDYLGLLHEVTNAANGSDQLDHALKLTLEIVCTTTGWPIGHALTRADQSTLQSTGIWHIADPHPHKTLVEFRQATAAQRFPVNMGLPGRVLACGNPEWIADLEVDGNYPRQSLACQAQLASSFAFPLRSGEKVIGVLEFYARTPQNPDTKCLEVMAQVGVQLGRVFERQRAQEARIVSEQRTRQILDSAGDAFIGMNTSGRITAWNEAAAATFGWAHDEALGRLVSETIIPPQYRQAHEHGFRRFLNTRVPRVLGQRLELSALDRSGNEFPVEITLWSLSDEIDTSFYAFARDITERKRRERELEQQAHHDVLTGVANRKLLLDRLAQLLVRRHRPRHGPAVLFIDLDHFKRINDSLGHTAGDHVLIAVAHRLCQTVRPVDTVARLAGDEFVVLCPDVETHRDAATIAQRLFASFARPIQLDDDSVFVTVSVGIAIADDNSDGESLIGAADTAMYHAKRSGRGQYQLFDTWMHHAVTSHLRTENELRKALEDDQLRLSFQPIVTAADGRLAAVEALLRWQHPNRGLLSPVDFIPVAEESGLIVPIGTWVLKQACRCTRTWATDCDVGAPLYVSVNLSARQLAQSDLVPMIDRILKDADFDPARIQFGIEVTETVIMHDVTAAARTLRELRALGIHISIDDFGTGYSSLAYLKHFPVDTIKLDKSFVDGVANDPADLAIVQAVTALARALSLSVVAEGVETVAQAKALRDASVDLLQGFLYARPQPLEQLRSASWPSCEASDIHVRLTG